MRPRRTLLTALAVAFAALGLLAATGCGGGGDGAVDTATARVDDAVDTVTGEAGDAADSVTGDAANAVPVKGQSAKPTRPTPTAGTSGPTRSPATRRTPRSSRSRPPSRASRSRRSA